MARFLRLQCEMSSIRMPQWINLSRSFHAFYGLPQGRKSFLKTMLEDLRLPFVGQHHNGLDDALNAQQQCTGYSTHHRVHCDANQRKDSRRFSNIVLRNDFLPCGRPKTEWIYEMSLHTALSRPALISHCRRKKRVLYCCSQIHCVLTSDLDN